jgi:hypothetical protein
MEGEIGNDISNAGSTTSKSFLQSTIDPDPESDLFYLHEEGIP